MTKYSNGFILGKFMPPHKGHIYITEAASKSCEKLTILVCTQSYDPIDGKLRYGWVKSLFPNLNVVHHPDPLPRDQTDPNFWRLWKESIEKYCPNEEFDVVFSSEKYGPRLAEELGAKHVEVDMERKHIPISATQIRDDPEKHWEYIPEIVKPYFSSKSS